jgi:hypothetical protein
VSTASFDRQPSAALIKPPDHIANGFEIVPAVLDQHDIPHVAAALEVESLERSRAGARHLMRHPIVQQVARDLRLVALASRFLGPSAIPFRATLFDKSPDHNWLVVWHQDTALPLRERRDVSGWGPWSVKAGITYAHAPANALSRVIALRLHIDDSGADTLSLMRRQRPCGQLLTARMLEASILRTFSALGVSASLAPFRPQLDIHLNWPV